MDSAPVAVSVFSSRNAAFSWSRGGHRIAVRGEAVRSGAGACAPSLGPYSRGAGAVSRSAGRCWPRNR